MAKDRMNVLEPLRMEEPDVDLNFLREGLRVLIQAVMEAEVATKTAGQLCASAVWSGSPTATATGPGLGTPAWAPWSCRSRRCGEGSYFPSLLEPRRRSERALLAVVQQAYVEGVSTRRVEDLVQALGCEGISKSQVSRTLQSPRVIRRKAGPRLNRCRGSIPI